MEMKKQKELLIIMPAYNEEKNIEAVLYELEKPEISSIADILVMNDASSDSTNWVVKAHGHTLVTHVFNLGYGSALQLGYKYAIRRKYKYVIQMDADGQHDVCNIPKIYERLRQKDADGRYPDIVLGSRFMEGSSAGGRSLFQPQREPLRRENEAQHRQRRREHAKQHVVPFRNADGKGYAAVCLFCVEAERQQKAELQHRHEDIIHEAGHAAIA